MRIPTSATPDASAHQPTVARSTRRVKLTSPSVASRPSGPTATESRPTWNWGSWLKVSCRSTARPGSAGRDDEQADGAVVEQRRHDDRVGDVRGGHGGLRPGEPPAVAVGSGTRRGPAGRGGARLGQRDGQHRRAGGDAGQPGGALVVVAELRDGVRGGERRPQRQRRDAAARLDEQQAGLEEAEAAAAVGLRQGDAEQPGLGELGPGGPVEPLLAGLDLLQALLGQLAGEDLAGEVRDGRLLLGECEVHGAVSFRCRCAGRLSGESPAGRARRWR